LNLLHWNKPLPHRGVLLADAKRYVESFLLQLAPGSVLLMERESKSGFLQLAILERRDQRLGVEFGLPDADWSHDQFELVHYAMDSAGYSTEVETNEDNEQVPRFLRVYVEGDRKDLTITLLELLETAASKLGFGVDDQYTVQMQGETDPQYIDDLATQLEQSPRRPWFGRTLAKFIRRTNQSSESSKK
jgi:hypothetical protein